MSLAGNLRTMAFSEILEWIAEGARTGTLHLERHSVRKSVGFREGAICTANSNDPREALGQVLIRERRITEEQLFEALNRQEEGERPLGAVLLAAGLIREEDLRAALQTKAEDTVYDLFFWPEGRFEFKDGELPDEPGAEAPLAIPAVIAEGARRLEDWKRLRQLFPYRNARFRVEGPIPVDAGLLEEQLLQLAEAGHTLAEMAVQARRSEFAITAGIARLQEHGLVSMAEPGDEPWNPEADPVGAINELLGLAYERMKERHYDGALKAYEDILSLDHLNQSAKQGILAVMEARRRDKVLRTIPLTAVPVLTVALQDLTGQNFDPEEGFVLSRINGQWDVESILKLCPMAAEEALLIVARLLERRVIALQ